MATLRVRRLSYALGAEITGIDLRETLDNETVARIRSAWLEHIVLRFPGQELTPEEQIAFCRRFGPLDDYRTRSHLRLADTPEVALIVSRPIVVKNKTIGVTKADKWHTDLSYTNRPATAGFLNAKQLPDIGGDTAFANMYSAYEALSASMRALVDGLEGVHDVMLSTDTPRHSPEKQAEIRSANPPVVHPVARVHPETNRKALYVGGFVRNFVGMSEEESKPILEFLNAHATQYEFVYRHRWTLHDLIMWDNRCALHYAVQDFDQNQIRKMQRCVLYPPVSGRVLAPATIASGG